MKGRCEEVERQHAVLRGKHEELAKDYENEHQKYRAVLERYEKLKREVSGEEKKKVTTSEYEEVESEEEEEEEETNALNHKANNKSEGSKNKMSKHPEEKKRYTIKPKEEKPLSQSIPPGKGDRGKSPVEVEHERSKANKNESPSKRLESDDSADFDRDSEDPDILK